VELRRQNLALLSRLDGSWARAWRLLDLNHLDKTFPKWSAAVAGIIGSFRGEAASLAAEYMAVFTEYQALRPHVLEPAQFNTSMRFTGPVTVKRMMSRGSSLEQAGVAGMRRSSFAAQRFTLDAERDVISRTAVADGDIAGWKRVGVGDCDFCRKLISKGTVYTDESPFKTHDHCACLPEPVRG
jgi:hypothetical protein